MRLGCYPSPLNYKGFPRCVTTSVNNVAVHGIPDLRPLEDGDIISIDVSVYSKEGFHGDTAATLPVGGIDEDASNLISASKSCLNVGLLILVLFA